MIKYGEICPHLLGRGPLLFLTLFILFGLVFLFVLPSACALFTRLFRLEMLFLKASFLACAALLLSSSFAAPAPKKSSTTNLLYPDLLEATTEELAEGLKKGLFTSVDLVNVIFIPPSSRCRSSWLHLDAEKQYNHRHTRLAFLK